jgi:hypothetical protein
MNLRLIIAIVAFAAVTLPVAAQSTLTIAFADPLWTGDAIPAGQHCRLLGGDGSTPALQVSNIPEGTTQINVEFNDESYRPLSKDGGHGIIGFTVTPVDGAATLPSVPGYSTDLPEGAFVVAKARTRAPYDSVGYLPPCSGGMGNIYAAMVKALSADGTEVGNGRIVLGKY